MEERLIASEFLKLKQPKKGTPPSPIVKTDDSCPRREPRKRAAVVGINYVGQSCNLHGCVNDTMNLCKMLDMGCDSLERRLLVDCDYNGQMPAPHDTLPPTRSNIISALDWLTSDVVPGDRLLFHFSGHGIQIPDLEGDEDDGFDEAIVPSDYVRAGGMNKRGCIADDEIRSYVDRLPEGVDILLIFDCCHSGTMADLCYSYPELHREKRIFRRSSRRTETKANVIALSGCQDYQVRGTNHNRNLNPKD